MNDIPLKPIGKEEIRKLELSLILGTLFRQEVLESIRNAEDKITWLDSLIIAAGAFARDRAGITISKIAEELGRSEQTIRNHLTEKTEAGKLVKQTYESFVRGEKPALIFSTEAEEKLKKVKQKLEEILKEI
ncbi:MAG: helix-turn-helix domain-containing protein [Candidatus Aenigmatarchaeota archaeon]